MEFSVNCPINSVSFGQVSLNILREFYQLGLNPNIIPIGPISLLDPIEQGFGVWLETNVRKALRKHNRNLPTFKLWHINGSLESISKKQVLMTFYETDAPTPTEINIVNNQDCTLFSSNHSKEVFLDNGAKNVDFCPLGFDKSSFSITPSLPFSEPRITFSLLGKFEKRKCHAQVIRAWLSKYGNNPNYFLSACVHNPFFSQEELECIYRDVVGGDKNRFFNFKFFDFLSASDYNKFLNSASIVIGMSSGEGWALPEFTSVALGKHAILLKAHAYLDWGNEDNAVFVNPIGKVPAHDGKFFVTGSEFNQGNFYSWKDEDFLEACEKAIEKVKISPTNWEGLKLQTKFTWAQTADKILSKLKEI